MNRNEDEISYVEVRDNEEAEWQKRIYLDDFKDGKCLCVHSAYEMKYKNNIYYLYKLWNYWREIKKHEYVPFDTVEETKVLKDKWINANGSEYEYKITGFHSESVFVGLVAVSLKDLFNCYSCDGSPCGKLKGGDE